MGRSRYKIYEEHYPYFITSSCSQGISLFADVEIARIVLDSFTYIQKEFEITLYAYVIMHNHFHCILEGKDLSSAIKKFKSYTARRIVDHLKVHNRSLLLKRLRIENSKNGDKRYRVWQEGFHPKQINNSEMMGQKVNYIHYNPVKAGFVDAATDWRHSSARNYSGIEGVIGVSLFCC
jgi:REP element-mobilizing transposase RayT